MGSRAYLAIESSALATFRAAAASSVVVPPSVTSMATVVVSFVSGMYSLGLRMCSYPVFQSVSDQQP